VSGVRGPGPWPDLRLWDARVVWLEQKQTWWWNAYRARTGTELHGFADSQEEATRALYEAIEAEPPTPPPVPGEVPRGGWQR
jgi:hypothetical protein